MYRSKTIIEFAALSAFLVVLALAPVAVPEAHAYGNTALWQIAVSFNCNNPSLCASLGGFWGWIEFDQGGLGDATLTGCSHLASTIPPLSGANHFNADITGWYVNATSHTFWVASGTMTITGHTGGSPVTVPITGPLNTGVLAMPGHFSSQTLFGSVAPPGTNFEEQVVQLSK